MCVLGGEGRASQELMCFWDPTAILGVSLLISCSIEAWEGLESPTAIPNKLAECLPGSPCPHRPSTPQPIKPPLSGRLRS